MARRTNTKIVEIRPDIQVAPKVKTTAYNDINLNAWKEYDYVKTDTLWEFPSRLKEGGHSNEYHGNFIPQIAQQLYWRYTKENDVVLDLFFGSGTSGIEAINMGRRCIGVELKDELAEKVYVTRQAVSRWENGETIPSTETLKLLSKLLKLLVMFQVKTLC